ncbi:MAG: arginine--tRNA ligase [Armatimonadota bacterium]|nr:arginine--tRNA ligase [Armatimonadota bacterium]
MIRSDLAIRVNAIIDGLKQSGELPDTVPFAEISEPRDPDHGDFATNFALEAAKVAGMPPRAVAEKVAGKLIEKGDFQNVEIAGPGFINLTLSNDYLAEWAKIAATETQISAERNGPMLKVLIEFVSVNPNGPIHLGHGRGAAYGDTLARCFAAAGHEVWREFYVNDGVNSLQMQLFGESVKALYRQSLGLDFDFPEEGYKGESVEEVAATIRAEHGDGHADDGLEFWQPVAQQLMIERQRADLERFGVVFDQWFSEQSLHENGKVDEAIAYLRKEGAIYENDGALFLKSTTFGDDRDRCVVRSNGNPTYIASDIAYHKDKFDRGHDFLIDVFGPDHHGYVERTYAAVQSLGYGRDRLRIVITQMVRFIKDGNPAPMRKRNGEYYRLSDLMDELGSDVVRFFYLMRSHDTHMDFDLDLALEHSDKNPVYYAQYAHARINSLLKKGTAEGFTADASQLGLLSQRAERDLVKKIWDLPYTVDKIVSDFGVHRLATYVTELAREYHNFYDKCPVLKAETRDLANARMALCEAASLALRQTLGLLGVSAPEEM